MIVCISFVRKFEKILVGSRCVWPYKPKKMPYKKAFIII